MTSYLFGGDAIERASRRSPYAIGLRPHVDEDGLSPDWSPGGRRQRGIDTDPDQGDYGTLFEHLLPKPAKYPKSSTYGGVLRSAAKAVNPYQTMPDRGGAIDATTWQYRPDRDPVEYQTMPDKGITQADLNRYGENLMAAVRDGKMGIGRAQSVWQAAVAAHKQGQDRPPETPQRRVLADGTLVDPDGSMFSRDENGNFSLIGVNPDEYQRGAPMVQAQPAPPISGQARDTDYRTPQGAGNRPVRAPAPATQTGVAIPRTANEAYQQAQQRSTADAQARQQRIATLKQRIATNRQSRLDDLNRRLGAAPSSIDPSRVGEGVSDLEAWGRQEAQRLGIDPEMAVRVANTEGGFRDPTRQNMEGAPAYGPFQLYVGGPDKPGLGDEALKRGIDPRNPAHAKAAVTFALEHAAKNGWGAFQGAAKAGIGDFDGIGQAVGSNVTVQQQQMAAKQGTSVWELGKLTPNQLTEGMAQGLDEATALAVCGPAAAIAFARKNGRNPDFNEALRLAKEVGWTPEAGMAGPASQVKLLQRMGIQSQMEDGAPNPTKVAQMVQAGNPVIVNTPGHYFVAERYDPQTGKFDFGQSAAVLKASGPSGQKNTWYTIGELKKLGMGAPRATIYMAGQ